MRQVKIKTPKKPWPLWARIAALLAAFGLGWLACYAWGFWLLFQALMRACENGMFICS